MLPPDPTLWALSVLYARLDEPGEQTAEQRDIPEKEDPLKKNAHLGLLTPFRFRGATGRMVL